MKFLVVTLAPTLKKNDGYYSYAPYVYEMNIWDKYVDKIGIISPVYYEKKLLLSRFENSPKVFPISPFSFTSKIESIKSFINIPIILFRIYKAMKWADHIHLRCPGNVALLACFVQILFPKKEKTVKYAGNWDPKSKQPKSYKVQKWILKNTFLTRNTKVLVYGDWKETSKNIIPFFTASYLESEKESIKDKLFDKKVYLLFVGTLSKGKQPLLSVQVAQKLKSLGLNVFLNIYGEGEERKSLEKYIEKYKLSGFVSLHGNRKKEEIKQAYKKSHFLVFISKSEGWPKVVAEAMFWKCLPISSAVSCVPDMLDYGNRGSLVEPNLEQIVKEIQFYLENEKMYHIKVDKAYKWSREYTLDKFELEISNLL